MYLVSYMSSETSPTILITTIQPWIGTRIGVCPREKNHLRNSLTWKFAQQSVPYRIVVMHLFFGGLCANYEVGHMARLLFQIRWKFPFGIIFCFGRSGTRIIWLAEKIVMFLCYHESSLQRAIGACLFLPSLRVS